MPIGCNFGQFPQHEAGSDEKFLSALVSAGLALGTAGLSVVAIITIHCMHMLVHASQTLGKLHHSPYLDYGEVLLIFSCILHCQDDQDDHEDEQENNEKLDQLSLQPHKINSASR